MIGSVRRIHLLTALMLLLSGLLQPLATAQGVTCAGAHVPAQAAERPSGAAVDVVADATGGRQVLAVEHTHDSAPQPDPAGIPAAPCGVAMLLSEQRLPLQVTTARQLPSPGDLPPTSLLSRFLFRPPRLS